MLDWVDVVRRLLCAYNVKTQAELSMAMGMPVEMGANGPIETTGIPWIVLEKAVSEKCLSWDWLMTGDGDGPEESPSATQEEENNISSSMPRYQTRELARELIDPEEEAQWEQQSQPTQAAPPPPSQAPTQRPAQTRKKTQSQPQPAASGSAQADSVMRNLRCLRKSVQQELNKLDTILEQGGGQETDQANMGTLA